MSTTQPSSSTSLTCTLESYLSPSLPIGTSLSTDPSSPALHILPSPTLAKLKNLGPSRVRDMRTLGHSKQVLSHVPIVASPQTCSRINDALYAAMHLNAEKFAALAMLPQGREAAKELSRCVGKYRFVGGVVGVSRAAGLDDAEGGCEELWSVAEKFRVPILVREMWPVGANLADFQGDFSNTIITPLVTNIHTSHATSPLPILRLYLTRVFDRHTSLRLILAHPGLLPSLLPRIETILASIPAADKPKRSFLDVWQYNIFLTTADVLDMSTMRTLLEQIPIDRILYASNYPLEERGKELMEELKESGFLSQDEWERVAWRNAEYVFGLKNEKGTKR